MHVTVELDGIAIAVWGDAASFGEGREFLEGWLNVAAKVGDAKLGPIAVKAKTVEYRLAQRDEIEIWKRDHHDPDDEHLTFLPGAHTWHLWAGDGPAQKQ